MAVIFYPRKESEYDGKKLAEEPISAVIENRISSAEKSKISLLLLL